jgi:hypothetical protein
MKYHKIMLGITAVLLLLSTASFAQGYGHRHGRGWQYLGQAHVDGRMDHDNISVGYHGGFRSIQLRVENAPIEFDHVVVHYENGTSEQLRVRQVIPAGSQTRDIDLRGDRRNIRSVELWYGKAAFHSGRPRVTLYGRS